MDTVLDWPWTTETLLAWEDRQERKFAFNRRDFIPMTGGSFGHQDSVFNRRRLLGRLLADRSLQMPETRPT
jgi:hypothetical protein